MPDKLRDELNCFHKKVGEGIKPFIRYDRRQRPEEPYRSALEEIYGALRRVADLYEAGVGSARWRREAELLIAKVGNLNWLDKVFADQTRAHYEHCDRQAQDPRKTGDVIHDLQLTVSSDVPLTPVELLRARLEFIEAKSRRAYVEAWEQEANSSGDPTAVITESARSSDGEVREHPEAEQKEVFPTSTVAEIMAELGEFTNAGPEARHLVRNLFLAGQLERGIKKVGNAHTYSVKSLKQLLARRGLDLDAKIPDWRTKYRPVMEASSQVASRRARRHKP